MIRRTFLTVLCLCAAAAGAPRLTTIQDTLYRADGTRFNGVLTISWNSFQSADNTTIMTQSTTVKVIDGNLRVQLVPSPASNPPSYYNVTYNSDGRVQFQEAWFVPASNSPVRVRDVRTNAAVPSGETTGATGTSGPIQESDVAGLIADLGARPLKGASLSAGRVAFVNALGAIDSVAGNASDCLHVDGSSAPCGGAAATFVDGDTPTGIVDGANTTFLLTNAPNPASSLSVYRNGMLQKAGSDYNATGNTVQFVTVDAPQPGDTLLASYRLGGGSAPVSSFAAPQVLCSGNGTIAGGTTMSSMGTCSIPAGLLSPGDRVEIRFDVAHTGTAGFSVEVDWGSTPILARDFSSGDALLSGRAGAAVLAAGAQLSGESWGSLSPIGTAVTQSADSYAAGLTIRFQAKVAQFGDSVKLAQYTVIRLP